MSQGYQPFQSRPQFAAPAYGPPALTDAQLSQLPPPSLPAAASVVDRPGVIAIGATLAVTASLQWICGLGLLWVIATVGADELSRAGEEGAIFHILNRFGYRMIDGLVWPLFGFPLLSFVTGLLVLKPRTWTRIVHSALGLAAVVWSAWWLRDHLVWWVSAAVYIAVACAVLWTPAASRWYGRQRS